MNGSGFYEKIRVDLEKAKVAENIWRKVLGMLERARFFSAMARKIVRDRTNFRTDKEFISQWAVVDTNDEF